MSKITVGGTIATVSYLAAIGVYVASDPQAFKGLQPNELGDFLAGVLGPLALFWLICGYLQQGIELQQNTRALELQVQELHSSVEQQRALVEVTREQAQREMDEIKRLRNNARRAALPVFVAKAGGAYHGNGDAHIKLNVTNIGAEVRDINFSTLEPLPSVIQFFKAPEVTLWGREAKHTVSWSTLALDEPASFVILMSYIDSLGSNGLVEIAVSFEKLGQGETVRFAVIPKVMNPE